MDIKFLKVDTGAFRGLPDTAPAGRSYGHGREGCHAGPSPD